MSVLITISDLPPELLYTILSHALADVLFHHLFVGALVTNDDHTQPKTAVEISSLGGVSVAWRITLERILGALLHRPNQDRVQSLKRKKNQLQQQQMQHRAHHHLTASAHASATSINHPISISASYATWTPDLLSHYIGTLSTMQSALRDLVQHSIDAYRREQDVMSQAHQTGVTTPTLLPVPIPTPPPPLPVVVPPQANSPTQLLLGFPTVIGQHNANVNLDDHLFGALLPVAATVLKEYVTTPIFQDALCYSQAAIFTCSSSNSFSSCTHGMQRTTTNTTTTNTTTTGGVRIQRPDLSTLVLTTSRLVTALEWVRTREEGYNRICPREVWDVADCGMREVRERIEDAIQVCRWNDLLNAVFLQGERSEEMIEALDGCFDELEAKACSIQMHHLLRSNLFKTIQTVARLGPISLVGHNASHASPSNPMQSSSGEVWRSRASALAFRWMGRVVEWTGI